MYLVARSHVQSRMVRNILVLFNLMGVFSIFHLRKRWPDSYSKGIEMRLRSMRSGPKQKGERDNAVWRQHSTHKHFITTFQGIQMD